MADKQGPPAFLTKHDQEASARWDALEREREELYNGVFKALGEMNYIGKLLGHQKIATVKDLKQKIEAAHQRIEKYLAPQALEAPGAAEEAKAGRRQGDEIPIEKHPLLADLGGMALEIDKLDRAWAEELGLLESKNVLDKAELQNQIKNKLQAKLKQALELNNRLRQRLANTPQPKLKEAAKHVNKMVVKYEETLKLLKRPILQPEAPRERPSWTPPTPKPTLGG